MLVVKNYRKAALIAVIVGGIIGTSMVASATYFVKDVENIAQQLKTYTESVKLVTNSAEQIAMQVKELTALPQKWLNDQQTILNAGLAHVQETINQDAMFSEDKVLGDLWKKTFPKAEDGDKATTAAAAKTAGDSMQDTKSAMNIQIIKSRNAISGELTKAENQLKTLLDLNKSPEGSKQAMQISNAIATEKAKIDSFNNRLLALILQEKVTQSEIKVTNEKNQNTAAKAAAAAESKSIQDADAELGDAKYGPFVSPSKY